MLLHNWLYRCSKRFPRILVNFYPSVSVIHVSQTSILSRSDLLNFLNGSKRMYRSGFHQIIAHVSFVHVSQNQGWFPSAPVEVLHPSFFKEVVWSDNWIDLTHLSPKSSWSCRLWVSPSPFVLSARKVFFKVLHLWNKLDFWYVHACLKVVPVDSAHVPAWSFDEEVWVWKFLFWRSREELFLQLKKAIWPIYQGKLLSLCRNIGLVKQRSVPLLLQVLNWLVQIVQLAEARVPGRLIQWLLQLVVMSLGACLVDTLVESLLIRALLPRFLCLWVDLLETGRGRVLEEGRLSRDRLLEAWNWGLHLTNKYSS